MNTDTELLTELLRTAGVIGHSEMDQALQCAKRLEMPLEQALISLKLMTPQQVEPIIEAKNMLAAGKISLPLASQVLRQAQEAEAGFEETLARLKSKPEGQKEFVVDQSDNPLAGYFLASHLINVDQLNQALKEAQAKNFPLGRTLVVNRFVSRWALSEVIDAVRLLKENAITAKQAVQALREAVANHTNVMQTLFESGIYQGSRGETITFVELLVLAGCLSESDYCDLEELELVEKKNIRQIITERNLVEPRLIEMAESLYNMIGNYLKPFQAAEALKQLKTKDITIYQAIAELKPPPQVPQPDLRLGDLLVQSGITTREAIEKIASSTMSKTMVRIGKHLLDAHLISETSLYNALRCQSLFKEGIISSQQAIAALSCAHDEKIKIEDAFLQCKLHVPNRMQWSWL